MTLSTYNFPTHIVSGSGARFELSGLLKEADVESVFVVTDQGVSKLPFYHDFKEMLAADFKISEYTGIVGNPLISHVTAGTTHIKANPSDAVIAIGGGAAMDVAKCIALMAHHPGSLLDYEDGKEDGLPADKHLPLIIALPTTAGTGSEVGRSAVVSDDDTHIKKIIFSPRLLPVHVLMDPDLTMGLPPAITAWTGMDACSHLSEAYLAPGFHPQCDGIAIEGLRLVAQALPLCVQGIQKGDTSPQILNARHEMLNAAMMGAVAFQKGLGAVHSCAHALSTVCDLHHGLANALMLPFVMNFNIQFSPERMGAMAAAVNAQEPTAHGWVSWLFKMNERLGIPCSLTEYGLDQNQMDALVEVAVNDPCHQTNSGPVTRDDFVTIFTNAFSGRRD